MEVEVLDVSFQAKLKRTVSGRRWFERCWYLKYLLFPSPHQASIAVQAVSSRWSRKVNWTTRGRVRYWATSRWSALQRRMSSEAEDVYDFKKQLMLYFNLLQIRREKWEQMRRSLFNLCNKLIYTLSPFWLLLKYFLIHKKHFFLLTWPWNDHYNFFSIMMM